MEKRYRIGILGGSGLYDLEGLEVIEEREIETPWGVPSDKFLVGKIEGREVVFLPRHGRQHKIIPSEINYRANIFGMKKLGVGWIISMSAVGSYREDIAPRDVVVVDQFFDRTNQARKTTFFDEGIAAHVSFAYPVCPVLFEVLYRSGMNSGVRVHKGGTYVNIEGPAFSTRAESQLFKTLGMDVVGMTNLVEARLAREAEICYSTIALVTDYDAWHPEFDAVTVTEVVENLKANANSANALIKSAVTNIPEVREGCDCATALENAIITPLDAISNKTKERLSEFLGKQMLPDQNIG